LEHQVNEDHAGDRHAELLAMGEIERSELTRYVVLGKHHLLLGAVHRTPPPDLPLQRPQLTWLELAGCRRHSSAIDVVASSAPSSSLRRWGKSNCRSSPDHARRFVRPGMQTRRAVAVACAALKANACT